MRTTVTLDDDVAALVESERRQRGETFREALNRLVRRGGQRDPAATDRPPLPLFPGRPLRDITDVSAVLAELEDEELKARGVYEHLGGHEPAGVRHDERSASARRGQELAD